MREAVRLAAESAPSTPAFILDTEALSQNAETIRARARQLGLVVLAPVGALPAPLLASLAEWAGGAAARTLAEARLGRKTLGGAVHLSAAGCRREDIPEILACCSHLSLRSLEQARRHRPALEAQGVRLGLTVLREELPGLRRAGLSNLLESGTRGLRLPFPPFRRPGDLALPGGLGRALGAGPGVAESRLGLYPRGGRRAGRLVR